MEKAESGGKNEEMGTSVEKISSTGETGIDDEDEGVLGAI